MNAYSAISIASAVFTLITAAYEPTWESLETRPIPQWFDEAKFGVFSTWGVYSVPSFNSEWFWYQWKGPHPQVDALEFMRKNYKPGFSYQDFAPMFTAEFFDPVSYALIVKNSGAKYFVFVTKHVEGFTMWPSNYSWNWNSVDVGPKRDFVGEFRDALQAMGGQVHLGLYYCLYEWFNQQYLADKSREFATSFYVDQVVIPQLKELVNNYQPDLVWGDGEYEAPDVYWKSKNFLAWLYNDSPVKQSVVVNDRWGAGTPGHHGGYFTFRDLFDPGHLIPHKWEQCNQMDALSWGFRRTMTFDNVRSLNYLLTQLVRTISCNGNFLLNIGPTHDGRIVPIFEERLHQIGEFIAMNDEAIYGTKPWIHQNDSNIWYTSRMKSTVNLPANRAFNPQDPANTIVYAFILEWPSDAVITLPSVTPTAQTTVQMFGLKQRLQVQPVGTGVRVDLSHLRWTELPSLDGWVLKFEYLAAQDRNPVTELINSGWLNAEGYPVRAVADYFRTSANQQEEQTDTIEEAFGYWI